MSIPELNVNEVSKVGVDGRATFHFEAGKLELWSPEHPRLYRVHIHADQDDLEDEMGFRTIECAAARFSWMAHPGSWRCYLSRSAISHRAPLHRGHEYLAQLGTRVGWKLCPSRPYPHDERMTRLADRMGILSGGISALLGGRVR